MIDQNQITKFEVSLIAETQPPKEPYICITINDNRHVVNLRRLKSTVTTLFNSYRPTEKSCNQDKLDELKNLLILLLKPCFSEKLIKELEC